MRCCWASAWRFSRTAVLTKARSSACRLRRGFCGGSPEKRNRESLAAQRWRHAAVPVAIVLALTAAFMGYYNHRLTGSALVMPHVLNTRVYHSAPLFLWEHPGPEKTYRNAQFEDFYNGWERDNYHITLADIRRVTWEKIFRCGVTYFWPGLLLALPGLPFALRDRKMRLPLVSIALGIGRRLVS